MIREWAMTEVMDVKRMGYFNQLPKIHTIDNAERLK